MADSAPIPVEVYQPGGAGYAQFLAQYGSAAADRIAHAARSGNRQILTETIAQIKYGEPLSESTLAYFVTYVATDPLTAPLDALDKGVNQLFSSSGVKTLVIVAIVAIVGGLIVRDMIKGNA